jgi:hypothetical protein
VELDSRQQAFIRDSARWRLTCFLGMLALTILLVTSGSCRSRPPFTPIDEPSYARSILESSLIAFNNSDYDTYLRYKHPSMTTSSSREHFDSRVSSIMGSFGDYIPGSAQFSDASFQYNNVSRIGYTVVYYHAKFTKNPTRNVLVHITFREIDGKLYVNDVGFNTRVTAGK